MPYYFMRDTPLQALEQLMMSQPGQKPRGGGIYRSPFHYTPKDVACEYCQNYVRKHPCRLCECTCLEERIEAGVLELNEFVRDCFAPSMGPQLRKRMHRAAQKQLVSGDVMLQKLLECLNGKEITSAGHLSARNFSFGEEIIESDGKLNFYLQADFDVDAAFGTFVCTDQNDDWLNIYANYDIEKDRLCDTLELNLCKGDGTEENWSYHLNAAEQEVLARKMEAFCQQQTGMSLHEYAQQLRESGSQTPEMQM